MSQPKPTSKKERSDAYVERKHIFIDPMSSQDPGVSTSAQLVGGIHTGMINSFEVPQDFLPRYLGGKALTTACTPSFNGKSLTARNALLDTGANAYLLVSVSFAKKSGFF